MEAKKRLHTFRKNGSGEEYIIIIFKECGRRIGGCMV